MNMRNLIYITGAPRCGKTTLANELTNENNVVFSLDAFSKSIRSVFSDFKLYAKPICIRPDTNKETFLELVSAYIKNFQKDYPEIDFIVEGCHFTPQEFKAAFYESKIVCLGRTKSKENIINAIKSKDWMATLNREAINEYADLIYDYSHQLRKNCSGYLYFETDEIDMDLVKKYIYGGNSNA